MTKVGVLSYVWSLLLYQATTQLPVMAQSAPLLLMPDCHWRQTISQYDSHTSWWNPTPRELAHPEFSTDLPISFSQHRAETLSAAESPFQVKGLLPHPSSSQPSQGCSQNWPLGKCSDWRVKQEQPCDAQTAAWIRQFPWVLSTSEEIIAMTGEAVKSKVLSGAKGSKRILKQCSWLCLDNSLPLSSAFLKTGRKAAMHKHFYHCLSIPKVPDTARRNLSMETMQSWSIFWKQLSGLMNKKWITKCIRVTTVSANTLIRVSGFITDIRYRRDLIRPSSSLGNTVGLVCVG